LSIDGLAARPTLARALLGGLASGAVAVIVAALLSLPLRSPDDVFFNSVSVTVGALLAGAGGGLLWWAAQRSHAPVRTFGASVLAGFLLVAVLTLVAERMPGAPLERVAGFVLPLAAAVFGVVAVLTPLLVQRGRALRVAAPMGVVAAVILGVALAGEGDAESGKLALPALRSSQPSAAVATVPPDGGSAAPVAVVPPATSAVAGTRADGLLRAADVGGVTFKVSDQESQATYTVREKLARLPLPNDAVGRTNALTGEVYLDGRPSRIMVDLRTLRSDQPQRDRFVRTMGGLPFDRYPTAVFSVADLTGLPESYRPGETVVREVTGMMKIREVERPQTFVVEARLQDGVLYILGTTDFTWADYQIPPPNLRGIVEVEEKVQLEVLIVAKQETRG